MFTPCDAHIIDARSVLIGKLIVSNFPNEQESHNLIGDALTKNYFLSDFASRPSRVFKQGIL